ncbi:2,3-bisphosphoglycerate-independent phosphoglycerate mutase [Poriferisphaera corsica]|uniref:2,3-bisphosphoglycerate-independent phosphoglycerate mutase n=1 Tax=Poriferisphaera corsica TaxID=2528020 RepID=A0A517YXE3_9BACT|nr:2,3-bisphosphoglycerate-independent phosphoglycerate mutase [Poriferisphaera corsica]QDU34889.1 2,3-bisphosphoglycerate-independent phosphoglycerate mutase [Poriferisphaera corsica]
MSDSPKPVVVIVRDGWGDNPNPEHDAFNAIKLAKTPRGAELLNKYPWTLIHTSGEMVGLNDGTMGNSEVGHQNIGAGRIVNQESVRITKSIRDGDFFDNEAMVKAVKSAKAKGGYVHLLGIASDAGVHGMLTHLYACIELCKKLGQEKVAIHLFCDGRDTGPYTGKGYIEQIVAKCAELGVGSIASIIGRYYAMDRDNRWERVKMAYDLLTTGEVDGKVVPNFDDAISAAQNYYDNPTNDSQNGDEFIMPRTVGDASATRIKDGDSVIFYNYRGDRPREITRAFMQPDFFGNVLPSPESGAKGFERKQLDIQYVCMTAYDESFIGWPNLGVAYLKPPKMINIGGEYLSKLGKTQFRCAETEKFPHVTFFANDYREEPFPGEGRQMAQSPKVATYDLQPEMSAYEIRDIVLGRVNAEDCEDFILVNFANGDMVGHTGKLDAAIKAVETVDQCVGEIVDAVLARGGKLIVTADHGNAEQMFNPDTDAPHTAHTLYDVECILVDPDLTKNTKLVDDGKLADIFPTVLKMMKLDQPAEMTGVSLF